MWNICHKDYLIADRIILKSSDLFAKSETIAPFSAVLENFEMAHLLTSLDILSLICEVYLGFR